MSKPLKFDEIGSWSEIKLEIIRKYASAYSTILSAQRGFHHSYIDAFAGAGVHISKDRKEFVQGSPLIALSLDKPFDRYFFIDLDGAKAAHLRKETGNHGNVYIYEGDCNKILLESVLPAIKFTDYQRALCILDPYGLHLNWEVICAVAQTNAIEIFLNFPVADMNRNVLWRNPAGVDEADIADIARMNAFWGDESWKTAAYSTDTNLFGLEDKKTNHEIAEAFRKRLLNVAGFKFAPEPLPMKNSKGAVVYYLMFASHNKTGDKIAKQIFMKHVKAQY